MSLYDSTARSKWSERKGTIMTRTPQPSRRACECYGEGRRAYPQIAWSEEEFLQAWSTWTEDSGECFRSPSYCYQDEYIRLACLARRPGAEHALERDYIEPLSPAIRKICGAPEATLDVLQKVRAKLLLGPNPGLASFRPGNFRAWLKVIATRAALDEARRRGIAARREVDLPEELQQMTRGPEEQLMTDQSRALIERAIRSATRRLSRTERRMLRLHLVSGWGITQIGRVFSVHRATVARRLISAKARLAALVNEELAGRVDASDSGCEFAWELPSQVDVGMSRLFATVGGTTASVTAQDVRVRGIR